MNDFLKSLLQKGNDLSRSLSEASKVSLTPSDISNYMTPTSQERVDDLASQLEKNRRDVQAPWEMKANEQLIKSQMKNAPQEPTSLSEAKMPFEPVRSEAQPNFLDQMLNLGKTSQDQMMSIGNPAKEQPAPNPVANISKASGPMDKVKSSIPEQTPPGNAEMQPPEEDVITKLLGKRESDMNRADLLDNLFKAGTAYAGRGRVAYDPSMVEGLRKAANRPIEDLMAETNLDKARSQMNDDKARRDPNSELSKMSRASTKDSLLKIGRSDLASKVTDKMSHKQIEDLFGNYNLQNMVTNWETQQARKELNHARLQDKIDTTKDKKLASELKMIQDSFDKGDETLARKNTGIGTHYNVVSRANSIKALINSFGGDLNAITPQMKKEIVTALDAMLAGGTSTVSGRAGIDTRTAMGDIQNLKQYILNKPKGALSGKIIKNQLDTVDRELEAHTSMLKDAKIKHFAPLYSRIRNSPEAVQEFEGSLRSQGLTLDDIKNVRDGKQSQTPLENKPEVVYQNGHKYTLNKQTGEYE